MRGAALRIGGVATVGLLAGLAVLIFGPGPLGSVSGGYDAFSYLPAGSLAVATVATDFNGELRPLTPSCAASGSSTGPWRRSSAVP